MDENQNCIVVGMGHATAQFVPTLRKLGWKGRITWLGDEGFLPYKRPPLSKDFLNGESNEPTYIRAAALYDKLDIDYHTNLKATNIDANSKQLTLENGDVLGYDKLVLATGGQVRKLQFKGADLENVYYLRTLHDALKIKQVIQPNMNAIVIGGGYIGLEMAASLAQKNINVTVLETENRVLQRVTSPEISNFMNRFHKENGVEILVNKRAVAFEGTTGVNAVKCSDGSIYKADIVIIGIGIIPNIALAKTANLELNNGILINEFCQTSNNDIYAIGDCANQNNRFYNTPMRIESVPNAMEQANIAANHICGKQKEYASIPWFWSHQYNLKWQIAGISSGYDKLVVRGNPMTENSFVIWYFKNECLIAADCLNRPMEFMIAKKVLTKGIQIPSKILGDEKVTPKELMKYIQR